MDDFIDKTVNNIPLKKTTNGSDLCKKCHSFGNEILFAPFTSIIPYETGSHSVAIELRRLGYFMLPSEIWKQLTKEIYTIANNLNK